MHFGRSGDNELVELLTMNRYYLDFRIAQSLASVPSHDRVSP